MWQPLAKASCATHTTHGMTNVSKFVSCAYPGSMVPSLSMSHSQVGSTIAICNWTESNNMFQDILQMIQAALLVWQSLCCYEPTTARLGSLVLALRLTKPWGHCNGHSFICGLGGYWCLSSTCLVTCRCKGSWHLVGGSMHQTCAAWCAPWL